MNQEVKELKEKINKLEKSIDFLIKYLFVDKACAEDIDIDIDFESDNGCKYYGGCRKHWKSIILGEEN